MYFFHATNIFIAHGQRLIELRGKMLKKQILRVFARLIHRFAVINRACLQQVNDKDYCIFIYRKTF